MIATARGRTAHSLIMDQGDTAKQPEPELFFVPATKSSSRRARPKHSRRREDSGTHKRLARHHTAPAAGAVSPESNRNESRTTYLPPARNSSSRFMSRARASSSSDAVSASSSLSPTHRLTVPGGMDSFLPEMSVSPPGSPTRPRTGTADHVGKMRAKLKRAAKRAARKSAFDRLTQRKTSRRAKKANKNAPKLNAVVFTQLQKMLERRHEKAAQRKAMRARRHEATKQQHAREYKMRTTHRERQAAVSSRLHARAVMKQKVARERAEALAERLRRVGEARMQREADLRAETQARMAESQARSESVRRRIEEKRERSLQARAVEVENRKKQIALLREQETEAAKTLLLKSKARVASRLQALADKRNKEAKARRERAGEKQRMIEQNRQMIAEEEREWQMDLVTELDKSFSRVEQLAAMKRAMIEESTFIDRVETISKSMAHEEEEEKRRARSPADFFDAPSEEPAVVFQTSSWSQATRMAPKAAAATPGPGEYAHANQSSLRSTGGAMGRSKREPMIGRGAENTPGAGAYDDVGMSTSIGATGGGFGFGIGTRFGSTSTEKLSAKDYAQAELASAGSAERRRQSVVMVRKAADELRKERVKDKMLMFTSNMRRRCSLVSIANMANDGEAATASPFSTPKKKSGFADVVVDTKRRAISDALIRNGRRRATEMLLKQLNQAAGDTEDGSAAEVTNAKQAILMAAAHKNAIDLVQQSETADAEPSISEASFAQASETADEATGSEKDDSSSGRRRSSLSKRGTMKDGDRKKQSKKARRKAAAAVTKTVAKQVAQGKEAMPPLPTADMPAPRRSSEDSYNIYESQAISVLPQHRESMHVAAAMRWEGTDRAELDLSLKTGSTLYEMRKAAMELEAEAAAQTSAAVEQVTAMYRANKEDYLSLGRAQDMIIDAFAAELDGGAAERVRLLESAAAVHERLLGPEHMDTVWVKQQQLEAEATATQEGAPEEAKEEKEEKEGGERAGES